MSKGIVKSILDTDLYKFTTSFAYQKLFPNAQGIFVFCDRNNTVWKDREKFLARFEEELIHLRDKVRLTPEERDWAIKNIPYIPKHYWEWLETFRFDPGDITYFLDEEGHAHISAGSKETPLEMYKVTLWEIAILCIMAELQFEDNGYKVDMGYVEERLHDKIKGLSNVTKLRFSEFGTRRRCNYEVQDFVVRYLKENALYCMGTSNVHLAMKYDMKPMGTFPHEWPMFHGATYGYRQANHLALENWVKCYDGYLGIALSDTYTTDVFLGNFSKKLACLFDGVRQDSGDEYEFTEKVIARYNELGINPMFKTIVFSNALDFPKAEAIRQFCNGKINCSFGIGTNLTNDTGNKPANIVMKLMECRMNEKDTWKHCIKLSDDLGKHMGDKNELLVCETTLGLR